MKLELFEKELVKELLMFQSSGSFCDKRQAKSHLGDRGLFYLRSYISSWREVKREVKELIWIQERKQRGKRSAV